MLQVQRCSAQAGQERNHQAKAGPQAVALRPSLLRHMCSSLSAWLMLHGGQLACAPTAYKIMLGGAGGVSWIMWSKIMKKRKKFGQVQLVLMVDLVCPFLPFLLGSPYDLLPHHQPSHERILQDLASNLSCSGVSWVTWPFRADRGPNPLQERAVPMQVCRPNS
jgi:hypothetical protein